MAFGGELGRRGSPSQSKALSLSGTPVRLELCRMWLLKSLHLSSGSELWFENLGSVVAGHPPTPASLGPWAFGPFLPGRGCTGVPQHYTRSPPRAARTERLPGR